MVKSILVDSNIYIRMLQNGLDPVINLGSWAKENDLVTYGILRMEVLRGIKNQDVGLGVEKMFDLMIHVPARKRLWENASQLAWQLDRKGLVLPAQDILIACCARQVGAAVMTSNRHFHSIPELEVIDDPF